MFGKMFEGEMFGQSLPTTLLEIFGKIILIFKVIVRSVKNPDDNFKSDS